MTSTRACRVMQGGDIGYAAVVAPFVVRMPAVVVLVGAAASGKTTLRHRLVIAGLDPALVVSIDDERAFIRDAVIAQGREPKPLQHYTLPALRRVRAQQQALLVAGQGYVSDATNLPRSERRQHTALAAAHGLPARALLLPALPPDVLAARDALRPELHRVPVEALARHAHRRSLLHPDEVYDEGFEEVIEVTPEDAVRVEIHGGG